MATTVLTLALDDAAQEHFDRLRRQYFPPALNRIPAHVTLFHMLPMEEWVREELARVAHECAAFDVRVAGLRFLGRGVAYMLAAQELPGLHAALSAACASDLSAQDRQKFAPHLVVQNKVAPDVARRTLAELEAKPLPAAARAVGLDWWEYLGGPWRLIERLPFAG